MKRIVSISILIFLLQSAALADMEIRFLNVGQGECAVVTCDGESMIIDGGPGSESSLIYTIVKNSLKEVKYLVLTHPHDDHAGGLAAVLNAVPVGVVFSPVAEWESRVFKNMKNYADLQGTSIIIPEEGAEYSLGNATITILHCWPEAWSINDMSIVLRINYGNTSVLFTGDAEMISEFMMVDSGFPLQADVLKVGHHGSVTSSTMEFLQAVSPQYAVISCGYKNSYGHPHEVTLERLRNLNVELFRTDLQGVITMHSDGSVITFETERDTKRDLFSPPDISISNDSSGITRGSPLDTRPDDNDMFELDGDVTYVLNTKTHKFHYPNCSSVQDMKQSNRQDFFGTREEVIALGYTPCGGCKP